jgi:hypothetical protein
LDYLLVAELAGTAQAAIRNPSTDAKLLAKLLGDVTAASRAADAR